MENPLQPIAGYVDRDGNWISHEMVAAGYNSLDKTSSSNPDDHYSGFEEIRSKNKAYYAERYGNKECHICHGNGVCPTCNGKGWISHSMTNTTGKCPNCLIINGRASGKCSQCQGTGHVYGLK